ncbi:hypothetical protein [Streptomyces griseocarneus]|uniref:hypothetical protein n=1 Tax=Streptomyces griseocarneus TaxID=51201 RepID=UPI00167CEE8D|nr:hypothetical protein [Streptomyces griseocarneus]MBZ6475551.1 hypothetical protein [Streptomyces griseocarneus]GHG69647.1 hypothetical protein GCM10018779_43130 [Streptomyces griseocarneus]
MSDAWSWDYVPSGEHVVDGLPAEVVAEVERLAEQLAVLGPDALHVGSGRLDGGGLRALDIFGGRGFFMFLAHERLRLVAITQVTWTG